MATKKQKHAAGIARRGEFLAKEHELGRKSIEVENHKRAIREKELWEKGHKKHFKFLNECPLCTSVREEQTRKQTVEAVERIAAAAKKMLEDNQSTRSFEACKDKSIDLTRAS